MVQIGETPANITSLEMNTNGRIIRTNCLGGAYTTNVGVVRQLWKAAQETKIIKMDDVWITGILRERIGMPRQYVRRLDKSVAIHALWVQNCKGQK